MKMILDFDRSKCVACGACSMACMDQNDIDPTRQPQFRHVYQSEQMRDGQLFFLNLSMGCMHCEQAPCVKACPVGCLQKDSESGLTLYDNTSCIGCHSCAMACPFGAPAFCEDGKMVKCDGCITRIENGMQPACVKACPFGALWLLSKAEFLQEQPLSSLKRISEEILKQSGE